MSPTRTPETEHVPASSPDSEDLIFLLSTSTTKVLQLVKDTSPQTRFTACCTLQAVLPRLNLSFPHLQLQLELGQTDHIREMRGDQERHSAVKDGSTYT